MSRPWMPFYVTDYLGDTGHLNTTQHGAYFLLIIHYWRKGSLPDDDRQLANITKLPLRIWTDIKPIMQGFFHDGWKHNRIDRELAKQDVITTKRAISGRKGGDVTAQSRMLAKAGNWQSNAKQLPAPPGQHLPQHLLGQLPGKRVAVTITKKDSCSDSSEQNAPPQEAAEEEIPRGTCQIPRAEYDEMLRKRREGAR